MGWACLQPTRAFDHYPHLSPHYAVVLGQCSPGEGGADCKACARGTWSPGGDPSATTTTVCKPCPTGWSTRSTGTTSAANCNVKICAAGTGGVYCAPCPYSSYSLGGAPANPLKECTLCPFGAFTLQTGSTSASACIFNAAECPPGHISRDGACHICPVGTWSVGKFATTCTLCSLGKTTKEPGAPSKDYCDYARSECCFLLLLVVSPSKCLHFWLACTTTASAPLSTKSQRWTHPPTHPPTNPLRLDGHQCSKAHLLMDWPG